MSDGWLGAGDRKRHIRRVRGSSPIHAAGAGGLKGNLSSEVDAGPSALRSPRITRCRTSMTHGIMQSRNNIGVRQTLSPMAVASRLSGTNSLRLRTRIFSSIYGRPVGGPNGETVLHKLRVVRMAPDRLEETWEKSVDNGDSAHETRLCPMKLCRQERRAPGLHCPRTFRPNSCPPDYRQTFFP